MNLLPCPCCGSEARHRGESYGQNDMRYMIECTNPECGLTLPGRMLPTALEEDRWNRRAEIPPEVRMPMPPDGYRLLQVSELTRLGDVFFDDDLPIPQWCPAQSSGIKANHYVYARKIE